MVMFVDRQEEMKKSMEIAHSKRAELALVYGRRRVGKSRLLIEFAKKTGALYFMADLSKNILDVLSKQAGQAGKEFVKFDTWEDFFEFIYKSKNNIIIIDEFQYLYQVNKAWPSILQRWWEKIKETDKKIILCGSMISVIYKIVKGYGSALYGRKTLEMQVTPLKLVSIKDFFPRWHFEQLIQAYAVLGGIPRYLEEFDPKSSVEENIKRKIISKTAFLYNEPVNLLFEEFRDPAPYVAILLAITQGYVKFAEISEVSRIESHKLPKYLMVLERVGIIEKETPITERKIKIKTTRYIIKDNFYRFWFRFVFKNKSMIEQGMENEVFNSIRKELNSYTGKMFEGVCKEFIINSKFFSAVKIGGWWHKDKEIDIVALNDQTKDILFAECKWGNKIDAREVLKGLKEKSKLVDFNAKSITYAVFAKSFKERFREPNVFLFDLDGMKRSFIKA